MPRGTKEKPFNKQWFDKFEQPPISRNQLGNTDKGGARKVWQGPDKGDSDGILETGYPPIGRPERFPRPIRGTDIYDTELWNPTAQAKEETVDYALEAEKLEVLKQRLVRLEAKSVITSVDEIGMRFIREEIERISSRLPKDWDQFAQKGGTGE